MKKRNLFITQAALIAALYVVLTLVSAAFGLDSKAIQFRLSEVLTVLPALTPAAIPGLFIGCLLSNFICGAMLPDMIFGSLATLIGAVGTYFREAGEVALCSPADSGEHRYRPACAEICLSP